MASRHGTGDSEDSEDGVPRMLVSGVGSSAWQARHGYFNERFFMATFLPSRMRMSPSFAVVIPVCLFDAAMCGSGCRLRGKQSMGNLMRGPSWGFHDLSHA